MSFKYRPHRGSLADAMREVREFDSRSDLFAFLRTQIEAGAISHPDAEFIIAPYGFDKRINWNSHIVSMPGYGVVGFTDQMPPK